jgi:hypothetical protein
MEDERGVGVVGDLGDERVGPSKGAALRGLGRKHIIYDKKKPVFGTIV